MQEVKFEMKQRRVVADFTRIIKNVPPEKLVEWSQEVTSEIMTAKYENRTLTINFKGEDHIVTKIIASYGSRGVVLMFEVAKPDFSKM